MQKMQKLYFSIILVGVSLINLNSINALPGFFGKSGNQRGQASHPNTIDDLLNGLQSMNMGTQSNYFDSQGTSHGQMHDSHESHENQAMHLINRGHNLADKKQAIRSYQEAAQLPNISPNLKAEIYVHISRAHLALREYQFAINAARYSNEHDESGAAWWCIGLASKNMGHIEDALNAFHKSTGVFNYSPGPIELEGKDEDSFFDNLLSLRHSNHGNSYSHGGSPSGYSGGQSSSSPPHGSSYSQTYQSSSYPAHGSSYSQSSPNHGSSYSQMPPAQSSSYSQMPPAQSSSYSQKPPAQSSSYSQTHEAKPKKSPASLKDEGNVFFVNKNYQKAIDKYNEALDLKPDAKTKAAVLRNRARSQYYEGNYRQCVQDASTSLLSEPNNGKAYWYRAQCYQKFPGIKEQDQLVLFITDLEQAMENGYVPSEYGDAKNALKFIEQQKYAWMTKNPDNFYYILEVDPSMDKEEIDKIYKKGVLKVHPDKVTEGFTPRVDFRDYQDAYKTLKDKNAREEYDKVEMIKFTARALDLRKKLNQ